jgi:hypothetical protein
VLFGTEVLEQIRKYSIYCQTAGCRIPEEKLLLPLLYTIINKENHGDRRNKYTLNDLGSEFELLPRAEGILN